MLQKCATLQAVVSHQTAVGRLASSHSPWADALGWFSCYSVPCPAHGGPSDSDPDPHPGFGPHLAQAWCQRRQKCFFGLWWREKIDFMRGSFSGMYVGVPGTPPLGAPNPPKGPPPHSTPMGPKKFMGSWSQDLSLNAPRGPAHAGSVQDSRELKMHAHKACTDPHTLSMLCTCFRILRHMGGTIQVHHPHCPFRFIHSRWSMFTIWNVLLRINLSLDGEPHEEPTEQGLEQKREKFRKTLEAKKRGIYLCPLAWACVCLCLCICVYVHVRVHVCACG